jgi:Na+-driven multidrug efflux pump
MTTAIVLRSTAQVRVPMVAAIVGAFTNLILNWVLIFGHLGLPEMQIAGAALATLIARIVEAGIIFVFFFAREKKVQYKLTEIFRPVGGIFREYMRLSIPVVISDLLLAFGNNAVSVVMGRIGTAFVAANAITSLTVQMSTVFSQGVSNAASIVTGNTLGEGRYEDAYEQGKKD